MALAAWGRETLRVIRETHTAEDGFDFFVDSETAAYLRDALVGAGALPAGHDALEVLRVEAAAWHRARTVPLFPES